MIESSLRKIKISRKMKKKMKEKDAEFWGVKIKHLRYEYHQDTVQIHFLKGVQTN